MVKTHIQRPYLVPLWAILPLLIPSLFLAPKRFLFSTFVLWFIFLNVLDCILSSISMYLEQDFSQPWLLEEFMLIYIATELKMLYNHRLGASNSAKIMEHIECSLTCFSNKNAMCRLWEKSHCYFDLICIFFLRLSHKVRANQRPVESTKWLSKNS